MFSHTRVLLTLAGQQLFKGLFPFGRIVAVQPAEFEKRPSVSCFGFDLISSENATTE